MNHATAYVLCYIDVTTTPPHVAHAGTFSDLAITVKLSQYRTVPVMTGYGEDYDAGLSHLAKQFEGPENEWVWGLLDDRTQADMLRRQKGEERTGEVVSATSQPPTKFSPLRLIKTSE